MRQHVLVLIVAAFILTGAALSATAQQSSPMVNPTQEQMHQQDSDDESMTGQQGMMGHGMMGMMGQRGMHCGMGGPMGMMGHHPLMMHIIFALMDSNADGTISLQEFQTAHEHIFKAMDTNKDGNLTFEEMQAFMQGAGRPTPQH
jgi:hypothetical protein